MPPRARISASTMRRCCSVTASMRRRDDEALSDKVKSADMQLKGKDARIEQLGDTLVVTDLGSTNGIDVHWSQGPVRRLRPGETSVVLPDAVVAIGDAVVVEFVAVATL